MRHGGACRNLLPAAERVAVTGSRPHETMLDVGLTGVRFPLEVDDPGVMLPLNLRLHRSRVSHPSRFGRQCRMM